MQIFWGIEDNLIDYRLNRMLGVPRACNIEGINEFENINKENSNKIEQNKQQKQLPVYSHFLLLPTKPTQRLVQYWSNYMKNQDEIIIPFSQLLYSNRNQINYFQIYGVGCLLKSLCNNKDKNSKLRNYIDNLPPPCFKYGFKYIDWIKDFLKNSLRKIQSRQYDINCLVGSMKANELKYYINELSRLFDQYQDSLRNHDKDYNIIQQKQDQFINSLNKIPYLFGQISQKSQNFKLSFKLTNEKYQKNNQQQIYRTDSQYYIQSQYQIINTFKLQSSDQYLKYLLQEYSQIIQPGDDFSQQTISKIVEQYSLNSNQSPNNSLSKIKQIQHINRLKKIINCNKQTTIKSLIKFKLINLNVFNDNSKNNGLTPSETFIMRIRIKFEKLFQYQYLIDLSQIQNGFNQINNNKQQIFHIFDQNIAYFYIPYPQEQFQQYFQKKKIQEMQDNYHDSNNQNKQNYKILFQKFLSQKITFQVQQIKSKCSSNEIKNNKNNKRKIGKQQKQKPQQMEQSIYNFIDSCDKNNEFPTISDVYQQQYENQNLEYYSQENQTNNASSIINNNNNKNNSKNFNEVHNQASSQQPQKQQIIIQCPFCNYIAIGFQSSCPQCKQDWGVFG